MLAQAVGTLGRMFPGRLPWIALGNGHSLNEHITGEAWPDKATRSARLREGADIIHALLAGETVTHGGAITIADAKTWSPPRRTDPAYTALHEMKHRPSSQLAGKPCSKI